MTNNILKKYVPITDWLPKYPSHWLQSDFLSGLTTAAVVIPKSMAYAAIAGLPIQVGLYTALIPMAIYALLGTSRQLSVSTTATIAILTAGEIALVAPDGDVETKVAITITLALLVGLFLLLAAIFRLGFIANFISDPVLTGFKAGIGLVVIVDQIPKLLGLHFEKGGFFQNVLSIFENLSQAHTQTLVLGLVTLTLMLALEHFLPRVPAPLVAVIIGIAASGLLGLEQSGVELVGNIPPGFPAPTLPEFSLFGQLWPGAMGIALMSFTESIAAGRAFVRKGDPQSDANQELLALGIANIAGSFFRIVPVGGGTSQTAVNYNAGARTQMAELVTVGVVVATLLLLSPLIALMPLTTLAAVVVATTVGLLNPQGFSAILRIRYAEFYWSIVTLFGVVLLGTLKGILVAIIVSILTLIYYANHPPLYALGRKPETDIFRPLSPEHAEDESFAGLLILRTEGLLTFASAPRLKDRMWQLLDQASPQLLIFDLDAVPGIEYTALRMLTEFDEKLANRGITLWLTGLNPNVLRTIRRSPLGKSLGNERMFYNNQEAVTVYQEKYQSQSE